VPKVFAVDPSTGKEGDVIGIAGEGFANSSLAICRFGSVNSSIKFYTGESRIYITAPPAPADPRPATKQTDDADNSTQPFAPRVLVTCSNDGVTFSKREAHDYFTYV
jgi:hypothetical protein